MLRVLKMFLLSCVALFLCVETSTIYADDTTEPSDDSITTLVESSPEFSKAKDLLDANEKPEIEYDSTNKVWKYSYSITDSKKDSFKPDDTKQIDYEEEVTNKLIFLTNGEVVETLKVDYSDFLSEGKVKVDNYYTGQSHTVEINENNYSELNKYRKEINEEKEKLFEKISQTDPQPAAHSGSSCAWWVCTKIEKGGGNWNGTCTFFGSAICGVASKFTYLVCQGGVAIGCYVPKYKICVDGYWETKHCPIPSR